MYNNVYGGISLMHKPDWSPEEIRILKENYNKISSQELCQLLPLRNYSSIKAYANKHKFSNEKGYNGPPKYEMNHEFFSVPNILNSYYAGYIAADGNLPIRDKSIKLSCSIKDRQIIDNFVSDVEFNGPTKIRKTNDLIENDKIYKCSDSYRVEMFSKQLYNDLIKIWNITPQKSLNLKPPKLTNPLHRYAYIIGYFDGDGSVSLWDNGHGYKNFVLSWLGTYEILEWTQDNLKILCPNESWNSKVTNHKSIYSLCYNRKKAKVIYQSLKNIVDVPRLERKWKFEWDIEI